MCERPNLFENDRFWHSHWQMSYPVKWYISQVLACGDEACSREEELWAEVENTVVGGESKVVTGGVAFVCGVRREGPACGEEVCSREG